MNRKLQTLEIQTDSDGRSYKMQGTKKNGALPSKWINKTEHWHIIYDFRFLDERKGHIQIEINYYNEIIRIEKKEVTGETYYLHVKKGYDSKWIDSKA